MEGRKSISSSELKRLLYELKSYGADTCFRFRLIGEMWYPNFTKIVLISNNRVLVFDEIINNNFLISDLAKIVQFELDKRFQLYQPHFHYEVHPVKVI
jgi:hypothetical protein